MKSSNVKSLRQRQRYRERSTQKKTHFPNHFLFLIFFTEEERWSMRPNGGGRKGRRRRRWRRRGGGRRGGGGGGGGRGKRKRKQLTSGAIRAGYFVTAPIKTTERCQSTRISYHFLYELFVVQGKKAKARRAAPCPPHLMTTIKVQIEHTQRNSDLAPVPFIIALPINQIDSAASISFKCRKMKLEGISLSKRYNCAITQPRRRRRCRRCLFSLLLNSVCAGP